MKIMDTRFDPKSSQRLKILSLDGGPSTAMVLRILWHVQKHFKLHGFDFIRSVDMFAGSSDGAFAALYLARALTYEDDGLAVITACIDFHRETLKTFELTPRAALRAASGLFSMFDGHALKKVLEKGYRTRIGNTGELTLGDLKKSVSIECYNASMRQTATYTKESTPQTTLVSAALASAAFMPMCPSFRDKDESAAYPGMLMLDGMLASNSPIMAALLDGARHLHLRDLGDRPVQDELGNDDFEGEYLEKISLLSMGCNVDGSFPPLQRFFSMKWPPFGLQRDKELYQYGPAWMLLSGMQWLTAVTIQRQATDDSHFVTRVLGSKRFYRFAQGSAGIPTVLDLLWNPKRFVEISHLGADMMWMRGEAKGMVKWVHKNWMLPDREVATCP